MAENKKSQFRDPEQKYNFILNPYPDYRVSRCPFCENRAGQRKIPLLIHIEPSDYIALYYTCKYCKECDLLIAHKHEIEHLLTCIFLQNDPEVIGNNYMILGTVEKKAWREGMKQSKEIKEIIPYVSEFITYYKELRMTQAGWFHKDQKPPVMKPPESKEWVKSKSQRRRKK
jgi:hypothetical protein